MENKTVEVGLEKACETYRRYRYSKGNSLLFTLEQVLNYYWALIMKYGKKCEIHDKRIEAYGRLTNPTPRQKQRHAKDVCLSKAYSMRHDEAWETYQLYGSNFIGNEKAFETYRRYRYLDGNSLLVESSVLVRLVPLFVPPPYYLKAFGLPQYAQPQ